jgi:two-component system, cell cycle sensor histidine kinase and response regulator CckA
VGTGLLIVLLLAILVSAYSLRVRAAQRTAQAALQRAVASEKLFSQSFHASPVPLALVSLVTHRLTECNSAYERLVGWSRPEVVGRPVFERGLSDGPTVRLVSRRARRNGVLRDYPLAVRRRDDQLREVCVSIDLIVVDGELHGLATIIDHTDRNRALTALQTSDERLRELGDGIDDVFWVVTPDRSRVLYISPAYEKIWGRTCESVLHDPLSWFAAVHPDDRARITSGEPEYEYRIYRSDGGMRWIRTKTSPVKDANGEIIRHAGVSRDVTAQRELEEQLRHAQKMESIGMLAGGIAHDFNNLLAVISACSGMLAESSDRSSSDRELVDDISDAVVRASALTRQLLAFSRRNVTEPVVLDPNLVLNDTRKLLRRMVGINIEVVTSLEPDLRPVLIDRSHLVQVILNLAVNARDAMSNGGTLSLTTRTIESSVVLEVSDTGTGMTPEVVARACEPFFTTKEQGKGTGMGLAVVHGIVERAGGRLEIETRVGSGTTFRIRLPAFDGPSQIVRPSSDEAMRGVETIVIADDDDHVRRATARSLRKRGYTVIEAVNGLTALVALAGADVDLLLTDIVMPGMNGRVLAETARTRFPQLKILFMTGYTDDEVVHAGVASGRVDLIEKPFTIVALAAKVRSVLDEVPADEAPRELAQAS